MRHAGAVFLVPLLLAYPVGQPALAAPAKPVGAQEAGQSDQEARPAPPADEPISATTPPVARQTAVDYPAGASGDATVVLELTVDAQGNVTEAHAVQGDEPFSTAAQNAAQGWRFEPARRDGVAVAAKVRFEVRFTEPPPPPEAQKPVPQDRAAPVPGRPAPAEEALDVTVHGKRPAPGSVVVTPIDARQMPGAFGDPFRAIEAMPGVTPVASGVPFYFIRGAPPGNVGFYIDGIPIPLLYHGFIGPAVIHPSMIERVELHRGGYPARYGRHAGGIVAARTGPAPSEVHGEASVRVIDAGAYLAAPFGSQGSHMRVAGRYSYTALVLSLLTDARLDYWDYQALGAVAFTDKDRIGVFAFGAYDFIGEDDEDSFAGTEFHRLDLRYDHDFGKATQARVAVTGGIDRSRATNGAVSGRSLRLRTEVEHQAGQSAEVYAGADAALERFALDLEPEAAGARDLEALFPPRTDTVSGAYFDVLVRPEPWFMVEPGLRVDVFRSAGETAVGVDPRLSASFSVKEELRLVHSIGLVHQPPDYVPSLPGARIGGIRGGLQRALQSSAGVEVDLPEDVSASVTLFYNLYFNLSDPLGFSRTIGADVDTADIRALGYAIGTELLVKRPLTRRLGGMLSYTLSRSVRSHGRLESLSAFDRTHVANLALGYDLGRGYRIGARTFFASGVPTRELTVDGARFVGENRPNPFFRLDVRFEKRWLLGQSAWMALVAEVLNATASQEIVGRSCNPLRCSDSKIGPLLLPSLGVEAGF